MKGLWLACLAGGAGLGLSGQEPIGIIITEQSRSAFNVQGAGARATGLGGAFVAVADDATAVSFNPAGLAQLLRPEMSLALRWGRRSVAFEDVRTRSKTQPLAVSDSVLSHSRVEPTFFSVSAPFRVSDRTMALQLSFQRMIPLSVRDTRDLVERPVNGSGAVGARLFQSIDQTGQIDLYSLALAYELSERVLAGFSVNAMRGVWGLDSFSTKEQGGARSTVDFRQQNHLEGMNARVGLLWRWPHWALGLAHSNGFGAAYRGQIRVDARPAAKPPSVISTSLDCGMHWPSSSSAGLSVRPAEGWLFALDVNRTRWSKATYVSPGTSLQGLGFFDLVRGGRTPDTTDLHAGVERLFISSSGMVIPLRLGYSREPQPLVDRITSEQRVVKGISLGSGFKRGAFTLDGAYRYGWARRRASQFLDVDQILTKQTLSNTGDETFREHRMELSLILQFDRLGVERVLRKLFVGDGR